MTSFLDLPGTSGNHASTLDAAGLEVAGDIDIRIDVAMDDWTPAAFATLAAKFLTTGNQRSWQLGVTTSGQVQLAVSPDGTATATSAITGLSLANGERTVLRVTLDVDNGAAGRTAELFTGPTMSGPWTSINTDTDAGTTSIFNGTAAITIGGHNNGTAALWGGQVYAMQVRDGIDGTLVANPIFSAAYPGDTSLTDSEGNTWTWAAGLSVDDGVDLAGSVEGLQDAAQTNWGLDLNGALKAATGLNKDANGISRAFWGRDLYQARRQALALLEGGGGQATPPP